MPKKEEEMMTEEMPEGAMPPEETVAETTEPESANTIDISIDSFPNLVDKVVGDTLTMSVSNISDDGKTYTLSLIEEAASEAEAGVGREAIAGEFS